MAGSRRRETMSLKDEKSARLKHYKEGFKEAIGQSREDALQEGLAVSGRGVGKACACSQRQLLSSTVDVF